MIFKKSKKAFLLIFITCAIATCQHNPEKMFREHVSPTFTFPKAGILFHKERSASPDLLCFKFNVNPELEKELVAYHKLKPVKIVPDTIVALSNSMDNKLSWWKYFADFKAPEKYLATYKPVSGVGDSQMRFLVIDGFKAYFMTSGHFESSQYVLESNNQNP